MAIAASKQYRRNRYWGRVERRHTKANGSHIGDNEAPRPPEGTVLPMTGMIVGPDPSTRAGRSKLDRPLYIRCPDMFTTAGKARALIAAKKQRGKGNAHRRAGLSIRQVERLRHFCRGSNYKNLGNRS